MNTLNILVLFFLAIVSLLCGAGILQSRHGSPERLKTVIIGILFLFLAGAFLDGALVAGSGYGPVLGVFLVGLPGSVAVCLVLGLIIQSIRWVPGVPETGGTRGAARRGARDTEIVNPATGLPMVGGVDAAGNSWGSDGDND